MSEKDDHAVQILLETVFTLLYAKEQTLSSYCLQGLIAGRRINTDGFVESAQRRREDRGKFSLGPLRLCGDRIDPYATLPSASDFLCDYQNLNPEKQVITRGSISWWCQRNIGDYRAWY